MASFERSSLENRGWQMELVRELLGPLLSQVCGNDHEQLPLPLGPFLGEQQPGFNRLSESDLVGEDRALREWILERKERCVHLVRIEVHLRVGERGRQL